MARRTAEDTRRLILDAALQLLLERGASAGVQHIRLQEVLRKVGLTTGAAYRIWADQTDFHRDLAVAMMQLRVAPPTSSAEAALREAMAAGGTLDDVIRYLTLDHVEYATRFHTNPESRDSHAFITALSLRTAAGAWPELRDASAERHNESIEEFTRFYSAVLDHFGYRVKSPLTIRDFAEAMAALGEGFAVRAAEALDHPTFQIGGGEELPPGDWTLFGLSARALVESLLVPIDAGDRATGAETN
jgi:AcrR family transcriptional regulator